MTSITSRPYRDDRDYQQMRRLLQQTYALAGPAVQCTVGDLDFWRFQYTEPNQVMQSCQLWLATNQSVVGFSWPGFDLDGHAVIDLVVHPHHTGLFVPMLVWAETWHEQQLPAETASVEVTTCAFEHDVQWTDRLEQRGYTRTTYRWHYVRSLSTRITAPVLPPSYSLRDVEPEHDVPHVVEVNSRSAPGSLFTDATYRAMLNAPTSRPDLHLVVAVPDPSFAAFCIIWYDEDNRVGLFEPVGCHPDHQRRGLATAMMSEGLRRLKHLGATHALVATGANNAPANALYTSLGFQVAGRNWIWHKTIERRG